MEYVARYGAPFQKIFTKYVWGNVKKYTEKCQQIYGAGCQLSDGMSKIPSKS